MNMWIPENAEWIIRELMAHGFEAYAVGGCVRDSILGREPEDWDITTSARPEQVKQIFHRTVDTGIEHGTVTVLVDKEAYEVTTYRVDGEYEDHRHPKEVTFTASLEEDLKRRDFTINAMAYNPQTGLVDIFEGIADLDKKIIRCVGDPGARFDEDALRILRAIRFSAQLGFEIDEATKAAMTEKAETLKDVSAERIRVELVKLLVSLHPEKIGEACRLGLTRVILPEYDAIVRTAYHAEDFVYDVENHTIQGLQNIEADPVLRLTMLMHEFDKSEQCVSLCKDILKRLKFDNYTLDRVCRLVKWHEYDYLPNEISVRRVLNRVGRDLFEDFIKVQRADILSMDSKMVSEKLADLDEKERIYRQIIERGDCFEVKTLALNGRDLIQAGIQPGPLLGAVLEQMVEWVIDDPKRNTKEQLLEKAVEIKEYLM